MPLNDDHTRITREKVNISPRKFRGTFIIDESEHPTLTLEPLEPIEPQQKPLAEPEGPLAEPDAPLEPELEAEPVPKLEEVQAEFNEVHEENQPKLYRAKTVRSLQEMPYLTLLLEDAQRLSILSGKWATKPQNLSELLIANEDEWNLVKATRDLTKQQHHASFEKVTKSIRKLTKK